MTVMDLKFVLRTLMLSVGVLLLSQQARAQFTVTEDFRGNGGPDIIVGDDAKLTSGEEDPVGAGWLRLTNDIGDQSGSAYINKSFPSTQGVLIDFEYTMWREQPNNSYNGADGLSIFLFDAANGPGNFELGAYGSSLGYANNTETNPESTGLSGGYIGIGLDSYGNFTAESEGKNGGSNSQSPNSITLRGSTTNSQSTSSPYLDGATITGLNPITTEDALNESGDGTFNGIDYNDPTSTRPDINTFYRRVQIEILPVNGGDYDITLRMATGFGKQFTDLITYTTSTPPPPLLKLGFAASTGGGVNNHEIRNLKITTLGNLRVNKNANVDVLRSENSNNAPSNEITYSIDVTNDTNADLENIAFEDKLTDGNGNPIPEGMFDINSISTEGFLSGTTLPEPSAGDPITNGQITGLVKLAANTTGTIEVKGKLKDIPKKNILTNTVNVNDNTITDTDMSNNTSAVSTPVVSEKSDLIVDSSVDESCLNTSNGNDFTMTVRNIGLLDLTYGNQTGNELIVTTTLPSGVTASNTSNSDWTMTQSGQTLTFTKDVSGGTNATKTLGYGENLPPINYTLESSNGGYTNSAEVVCETEDPGNTDNNTDSINVSSLPDKPVVPNDTITYCQYEEATPLTATADGDNTLLWALSDGGVTRTTPYTPDTDDSGTTDYWVAQKTPGGCRSDFKKITVTVDGANDVKAGEIGSNQTVCPDDQQPNELNSIDDGDTDPGLSYIWQKSTDNGQTWTDIAGETDATYQPVAISEITFFRRVTVNSSGCQYPTDPVKIFLATDGNCNTNVCTADVEGEAFSWSYGGSTPSPVTQTLVQPATNAGFVFDIYELDNSFNMKINGTKLADDEIEFQSGVSSGSINIKFQDGDQYETDTQGKIWEMSGEPGKPLIRVKIAPSGQISMFGSKTSSSNSNYELYPLEFIPTEGNSFNTINWNTTSNNTIVVTQNVVSVTNIKGYGSGQSLVPCDPYVLSKDGAFNDENSDNGAQPGETITYTLTVENSGDIDIYEPEVSDPMFGGKITVSPGGDLNNDGVLNTTETWTYTVEHTVTQSEIDAGGVYNQAEVNGKTVEGYAIDPVKSTDPTPLDPGDRFYDSDRPEHTFVRLPTRLVITNPMLPSKTKND